jgi:hypothetical protein
MRKLLYTILAVIFMVWTVSPALAAFTIPYDDFQSGATADPDEVDADFAAILNNMGTGEYTDNNYVTDDASLTANIDALDKQIKINTDAIDAITLDVFDWTSDTTDPVENDLYSGWPVIKFPGASDSAVWFTFQNPKTGYHYKLRIEGFLSGDNTTDAISFNMSYSAVAADGDSTPAAVTATGEDELSLDYTQDQRITHTGTNLKISSSNLTESNMLIRCKFWRDVDGASSNASQDFYLVRAVFVPEEE